MNEKSEYNTRQLRLMQKKIELFEKDKIYLNDLISDLESLLNVLEDFDLEWKNKFRGLWGILEQIYAWALYQNQDSLNKEDIHNIQETIALIKSMIEIKLKDQTSDGD